MSVFTDQQAVPQSIVSARKCLKKGPCTIQLSGCLDAAKPHIIYSAGDDFKYKIIVSFREQKARELLEEYRFYDHEACYFPAKDMLFYQADLQGNVVLEERVRVFRRLAEEQAATVFTTFDGLMDAIVPKKSFRSKVLSFKPGQTIQQEELIHDLVGMGYTRSYQAEQPGEFAIRGGIIDIFSLTEDCPFRMELWDDEIDSLRSFDAESQRSIENLEYAWVYPAEEEEKKGEVSFLEYFPPEETLVIFDDAKRCAEKGMEAFTEFQVSCEHRAEKGMELGDLTVFTTEQILVKAEKYPVLDLYLLDQGKDEIIRHEKTFRINPREIKPYHNAFSELIKDLKSYKKDGWNVIVISASKSKAERLAKDFLDEDLISFYTENLERELVPGEVMITHGKLRDGFEYPEVKFAVLTDGDIFGHEKKKKKKAAAYSGERIHNFTDLNVGDIVVHEDHGLGIYRGIEKVKVDGIVKDYIKIEYAKGDHLYVQVTQLNVIQKYSGGEGKHPKLNSINSAEWKKTRGRVKMAVDAIAQNLVDLYAVRQQKEGYVYGPDTVWQREFEELFPFDETEDQMRAIEAVKEDMESTKIMDRLICGDVGYGKTEIAIRAAFKAVQEGKQVVYLVPTTILAKQHFETFAQRMKNYPVEVEMLSRFRSSAENKKTIEGLKKGQVDIVIGTHRLLSKDVGYKNLGLLIIDEEQRFGVQHKEKIKELKNNVDVLTLTATPIPRTLHMSLIGIRDMSVLEEAPQDRQPIQTFVMEYDEEVVREAISRELARGGQVYYVYNRVNNIADVAGQIAKLIPEAVVAYAHGQMRENELEDVMMRFVDGEIDVLVSTTIVETGLDIPNVNTMIIHDAENFGLSQLYQLRGRVGRSSRTAYAFLMYRKDKMLKETAEKRLAAIREFTELGSGIRIAMRDLEIRGAGNLLGEAQSGNMEAVGYDLYCKMLNEAVREKKGEIVEDEFETSVELSIDAYIPATYVTNEFWKLDIYKRIASVETEEDREEMEDELMDRFGDLPKAVQNLLMVARLKAEAHKVYLEAVKEKPSTEAMGVGNYSWIALSFWKNAKIDPVRIPDLLHSHPYDMKFSAAELTLQVRIDTRLKKNEQLEQLMQILQEMQEMLLPKQ